MSKSFVTLEQQKCIVCGQDYDTGSLLLDRRLKDTFEYKTLTGWGLCPEHKKLLDDGYVALVGVDESKSTSWTPEGAYRTGQVAHLRRSAWQKIFNVPAPEGPMAFAEAGVLDKLQGIEQEVEDATPKG